MHLRGVLRAVLACGMGVQILLGLAWLVKNMGGLQTFQESGWLLNGEGAAGRLYSGALYRGLVSLLSSHLWILYGIQLAAALAAAYGLMACFMGKDQRASRVLGALALTAIPQALQCHLAVLPWSLGTSLLMAETALWISLLRDGGVENGRERRRTAVAMLEYWLLLLWILPVYAWFSLPLLLAILWRTGKFGCETSQDALAQYHGQANTIREKEKNTGIRVRMLCGLTGLALVLCCIGVNCGFRPAAWNRELAADALRRTGWPSFQYDYDSIPEPLHSEIGLDTARKVSTYADGVEVSLIPKLEERYGFEETTSVLWNLAGLCLKRNLRADIKNVIWDMAAYHAAPPILVMQLKGRAYDSLSGINYEQMKERAPLLSRYYVTYASRWWWVMLGLALVLAGGELFDRGVFSIKGKRAFPEKECVDRRARAGKRRPDAGTGRGAGVRVFLQRWFPVLAGMEWMILYFVAQGSGIMDYKKTLWVTVFWYAAALSQLVSREGEEG